MPQLMTTKEVAEYLKLHEVTVCKHAEEGAIQAKRIGRVWRFDKDIIDKWITAGKSIPTAGKGSKRKAAKA